VKRHSAVHSGQAKRITVIAIGNPLMRDDGAGVSVLQLLSGIPEEVAIIDAGTGGIGLLYILSNLDAAIIVDAVDFGGQPGEVRTFPLSQVISTKALPGLSLHEGDILKTIEMAQRLSQCPNEIVICAIQPEEIAEGICLSKPVKKALPKLARVVKETVKKML
jgi:hydrogenase maturation protease